MAKKFMGVDYSDNEKIKILFYLIIGGSAAVLEWALFYVMEHHLGWNYLLSAATAFLLSTIYHYFLTNAFVFESGARYDKAKEFSLVLVVAAMGLGFNLLLMWLFVGGLDWNPLLSKMLASAIVTVWNYLARKKWIY